MKKVSYNMFDITPYVKIEKNTAEDIETLMLFRCTTQEFAQQFLDTGNIRFGKPSEWIEYYKNHGNGRGDLLEGSFACIQKFDDRPIKFYNEYRTNVIITQDERNGNYYFQSSDVLNLRTFCLFGLNKSLFTHNLEAEDRMVYPTGSISKRYFDDFSNISQAEYESLPKNQKPVLLMIGNPHEFFVRLKQKLNEIGLQQNDYIIHPVKYSDMQKSFLVGDPMPGELFLKDNSFNYQSEIRVVITTDKKDVIELLEKNNGIIDLGNMHDIAEIQEYYFDDFHMQLRGSSILFSLPNPIETPITDPLTVISHIHQTYRDELPGELLSIEKRDKLIDEALAFLEKQFGITFDKETFTFTSNDGCKSWKLTNIWETLFNHGYSYYTRGEYKKAIDQYTKAIAIDPKRASAWYNRAVSYFKLGNFEKMIKDMDKAIELEPDNEKYIFERNVQQKSLNYKTKKPTQE
ncbi:MAG: tetratricopeptide repeat protein [Ruminococcus sp.]|nr:tetratricopeptide repeat protein [Ruminococcus sp.]